VPLEAVPNQIRASRLWILAVGLLVDAGFIQLDRLYLQGRLGETFSFEYESSYPERYQNAKELGLALLAGLCVSKNRSPLYRCWLGIYGYFFIDDSFELHETLGSWISTHVQFPAPFGLRGQDIGELVVSGVAGLVACAALAGAWNRSDEQARHMSKIMIGLVMALAMFGIVIDMLHIIATGTWQYRLGILEDGGEMMVITVMLWFMYTHRRD
jgi:hypothetical protein